VVSIDGAGRTSCRIVAEQPSDLVHVVRYAWVGPGVFEAALEPMSALGIGMDRAPGTNLGGRCPRSSSARSFGTLVHRRQPLDDLDAGTALRAT
jgi:hypothetical protein